MILAVDERAKMGICFLATLLFNGFCFVYFCTSFWERERKRTSIFFSLRVEKKFLFGEKWDNVKGPTNKSSNTTTTNTIPFTFLSFLLLILCVMAFDLRKFQDLMPPVYVTNKFQRDEISCFDCKQNDQIKIWFFFLRHFYAFHEQMHRLADVPGN